jgi:hypothetical protein
MQMLLTYNEVACLDSTHSTCFFATGRSEKAFLNTIVLKNTLTGKGVPAAFMITPSEAQYALGEFLSWLRTLGFKPKTFMIDCSDVEAAAISSAYPLVPILNCLWHVLKAVTEQAKKKLSVCCVLRLMCYANTRFLSDTILRQSIRCNRSQPTASGRRDLRLQATCHGVYFSHF